MAIIATNNCLRPRSSTRWVSVEIKKKILFSHILQHIQYGDEGNSDKVFMLEIVWGPEYPNVLPTISMDTYLNRNMWVISRSFYCATYLIIMHPWQISRVQIQSHRSCDGWRRELAWLWHDLHAVRMRQRASARRPERALGAGKAHRSDRSCQDGTAEDWSSQSSRIDKEGATHKVTEAENVG